MKIQFSTFAIFFGLNKISLLNIEEDGIKITTPCGEVKTISIHKSHLRRINPQEIVQETSSVQNLSQSKMDSSSYIVEKLREQQSHIDDEIIKFGKEIRNLEERYITEQGESWCINEAPDFLKEFKLLNERYQRIPKLIEEVEEETHSLFQWMRDQAWRLEEEIERSTQEINSAKNTKSRKKKHKHK